MYFLPELRSSPNYYGKTKLSREKSKYKNIENVMGEGRIFEGSQTVKESFHFHVGMHKNFQRCFIEFANGRLTIE